MPAFLQALLRTVGVVVLSVWYGAAFGLSYTPANVPNPRLANGAHVSDPDQVLGAAYTERIGAKLQEIERLTGAQVAVVAVNQIEGGDLTTFAQTLFDLWGIGRAKHDDGLLILLVKSQRQVRIHVGYGLEGQLPDVLCHRIQEQSMVPHFKRGEYGEGVLAGVNDIAQILSTSPSQLNWLRAQQGVDVPFWRPQTIALLVVTVAFCFVCSVFQISFGEPESKKSSSKNLPLAMLYPRKVWFLLFWGLPLLLVVAIHLAVPGVHWGVVLACLYAYAIVVAVWHLTGLFAHAKHMTQRGLHAVVYRLLNRKHSFWVGMAFVFPIPLVIGARLLKRRATQSREHPRRCPACKKTMIRLDEAAEDIHLNEGAQAEERVGSREHDVWHCQACGATKVDSYDVDRASWLPCSECKAITERLDSSTTLREATTSAAGEAQRVYVCMACAHTRTEIHRLPKLNPAGSGSSSRGGSSSSSGSSSGSSWGGGRSGGGGSTASW